MATSLSAVRYFGALALLAVAAGAVSAKPPEPGFWLTGLTPKAEYGGVFCLTQDGGTAGGFTGAATPIFSAGFTWTKAGGRNDFGLLAGMPDVTTPFGMSDNGVVVGKMWNITSKNSRAYRWTGSGALQDLGLLPGEERSFANGVSGDGSVVVGHAEHGTMGYFTGEAFRWTAAKGMQGLGHLTPNSLLSDARAVSRDGLTIVGMNLNEIMDSQAFVWTEAGGMKALPQLVIFGDAGADAVNADGSVAVGGAFNPTASVGRAVRWTRTGIEDLVSAPYAATHCHAFAVNDDGGVIGGVIEQGNGIAFIWTETLGMVKAGDYLKDRGVAVPTNYQLEYVYAVSGDGLTFGGRAWNLTTGKREGFIATVPSTTCVADCDASSTLDIDDFICFQTRFAISDPYADCDASGELDIDDFVCFQTFYAIGC